MVTRRKELPRCGMVSRFGGPWQRGGIAEGRPCGPLRVTLQAGERYAYDARRTLFLEGVGLKVVRFDSNLVLHDLEALRAEILALCGGARDG